MSLRDNWKNLEQDIAKHLGTNRTPLSGINSRHNTHSDTLHPHFYVEAKYSGDPDNSFFRVYTEKMKVKGGIRIAFKNGVGQQVVLFHTREKLDLSIFNVLDIDGKDNFEKPVFATRGSIQGKISWKRWARWPIWRFFLDDVCKKAKAENKLPLLAIRRKAHRGLVILCQQSDYKEIFEQLKGL